MNAGTHRLFLRVRETGTCPPSLLNESGFGEGDGFSATVLSALDETPNATGLALRSDAEAAREFDKAIKMAGSVLDIPGNIDLEAKAAMLAQRRSVLLAIIGSTPSTNEALTTILNDGFLAVVKSWLDDVLNSVVGGVDLLLHLLDSIALLPVTKEMITSSNAGKAVAAVKNHAICKGTKNENAIKERVSKVKEEWSASVRARKQQSPGKSSSAKRPLQGASSSQSLPKKTKTTITHSPTPGAKNSSSLSSLLKKVGDKSSATGKPMSAAEAARQKAKERDAEMKKRLALDTKAASNDESKDAAAAEEEKKSAEENVGESKPGDSSATEAKQKKPIKSVSWADQSGKALEQAHHFSGEQNASEKVAENSTKTLGSWSERRKRDRMREKELLAEHRAQARKAKLFDDADDMGMDMITPTMTPTVRWSKPTPLPPDKENAPVKADSKEFVTQTARTATVPPASYLSEDDVPSNPNPLTDIEQALELTSQASSSSPESIPWTPPPPQPQASAQTPAIPGQAANAYPPVAPTGATLEVVQAMGLPLFLVGSNVQALQTLAASPSLLQTFVDANGLYDQARLMNLVQTLTQNLAPSQPQAAAAAVPAYQPRTASAMSSHYGVAASAYQPPPTTQPTTFGIYGGSGGGEGGGGGGGGGGYRGDRNEAGNMHVSGYGPATTEHEIRALFAPYVHVDEVVMKGSFSFVNTSDPEGAARAREILNGALVGGMPIRVNVATRRAKDPGGGGGGLGGLGGLSAAPVPAPAPPLPRDITGKIQYDQVRDDRGNAATKNLFVAGYGMGTTEQQLREIFAPHCTVTSISMKSSFAFVNTSDRIAAIHAREALTGAIVNGTALRINFAKETGRLGTSFDSGPSTYGPGGGGGGGYTSRR